MSKIFKITKFRADKVVKKEVLRGPQCDQNRFQVKSEFSKSLKIPHCEIGVVRQFEIMGEPFEIIFPISKRRQQSFSEM